MVSKLFKKEKKTPKKVITKNFSMLLTYYNLTYLQMKLDYEEELSASNHLSQKITENQLKIIAVDKLLKLYFEDDYIGIYGDDNNILLTDDEKSYLIYGEKPENLIFIKNDLISENKTIIKIKNFYLISKSDVNLKLYKKIINEIL